MVKNLRRHTRPIPNVNGSAGVLPQSYEYAYYICIFYGTIGSAVQLAVPMLGAAMMAILAALCLRHLGSRRRFLYRQIALPLGCSISFMMIQLFVHGQSLMDSEVRLFVNWTMGIIIVQALFLSHGFLRRYTLAHLVLGLTVLPFMSFSTFGTEVDRISDVEGRLGALSGPNGLGEWFGFCAICFLIMGLKARSTRNRFVSWIASVVCLYIVGVTVSRGALLATAIAATLAFRKSLQRGFLPVLGFLVLSWGIYEIGVFDSIVEMYVTRGTEETGRLLIWPLVIDRILGSPLVGVGVSNIETYVKEAAKAYTPHNGFLYIALLSGIIPFAFFVTYWCRAALRGLRASSDGTPEAPFRIPLLTFAFLASFSGNATFLAPWAIVALANATAAADSRRQPRTVVRRARSDGRIKLAGQLRLR